MRKKLIEVALPLVAINKACKDDKDRKTGHIRNLHKWYAPMPLPAWRAALFASLIDDPGTGHSATEASAKRAELFALLETILPLDAGKSPALFKPVRELLKLACPNAPTVIDPFCGGGSTLLEAQRLGLRTIGSDLNPIPVLITTVLTRYPALFADVVPIHPGSRQTQLHGVRGQALVEDVRYYAEEVGKRAHVELAEYFPSYKSKAPDELSNGTVMSWIWSRTVKCPNPACGLTTPLASSFELTRAGKNGKGANWIQPEVLAQPDRRIDYKVIAGHGVPPKPPKTGRGANFKCVACQAVIDEDYLREQAQTKGLGFDLMASVVKLKSGAREYVSPSAEVLKTVTAPHADWIPDLELSTHPQYMGAPRYGMRTVGDLFTARQLKTVEVFARVVRDIYAEILRDSVKTLGDRASSYATAVTTILALCVSKLSQSHNVLVRWKIDSRNGSGKPLPAFDTQTVPAVWDFAENNPFGGSVGDWIDTVVPTALRAFDFCVPDAPPADVRQSDARSACDIGTGPLLVATDPPYYDSVPYADLSDVFYPLLRFMLKDIHPELFETVRPPRASELVADYHRFGGSRVQAQSYFLDGFREVFTRLRPRIRQDTPMTVVYSFKQQETEETLGTSSTGWEVLLRALLEAGFMVTATWPVRTTLENRSRDIGSNALASAILIICRARPENAGRISRRDFLAELGQELPSAVRDLQANNIAPVDLQQAMIGPGMAVFSKYAEVIDASGSPLSVKEALSLINASLDSLLAEQEGDFDADTRWALAWFDHVGFAEGEYGVAETLSKAKNTSISGLVDAGILTSKGGKVRLLKPSDMPGDWDPSQDNRLTLWEMVHHLIRVLEGTGESGAATLFRKLGTKVEAARELPYRLYSICERKKRAQEALSYNALVQSWPEISRLAREERAPQPAQKQMFEQR